MMEPDQFEQSTLLTNPQDGEITPTRIPSDESNPTTSPSQEDDDLIQEVPPPPPPPPTTTTNTTSSNQNQDQRFSTSFVKFDPNQTLPIDHTRSFTNSEYRSLMTRRGSNTGSIMTEDCSSEDKAGSSNLSLYEDDAFGISSDDPLDSLEKAYPRKGPSRYIIESDNRFTLWSLRGWLNIGAVLLILSGSIGLFALWPIYDYTQRESTLDSQTLELSRQSGPFSLSDLPQRPL